MDMPSGRANALGREARDGAIIFDPRPGACVVGCVVLAVAWGTPCAFAIVPNE